MTPRGIPARWAQDPRGLAPHYFALVMASGIVSVGLAQHGYRTLSAVPFVVAIAAYVVLLVLNGWRLLAHRDAVRDDLSHPSRAFGSFTFVAGTNVLGVRLAVSGHTTVAVVLLAVATVSWVVLGYVIPWTALLAPAHRPVLADANGSWFVWVVASQSVAVSAAVLEPAFPGVHLLMATLAIFSWSVGAFLYGAVGTMVSARLLLFHLRAEEIGPPYWIAMGAGAIGVLAGAHIVEMRPTPLLLATHELISGVVVIMWAFATWLIPALAAFGWWQHRRHRVLRGYDPALWSIVFPLGMYAVAGTYLGRADQLPLADEVGAVMIWVAVAVWLITLVGMARHLLRPASGPPPPSSPSS